MPCKFCTISAGFTEDSGEQMMREGKTANARNPQAQKAPKDLLRSALGLIWASI